MPAWSSCPVEQQYDVITSRAFAELKDFVTWSNHLLQQGGKYIALKGVLPQEEIERLPAGWKVQSMDRCRCRAWMPSGISSSWKERADEKIPQVLAATLA
jgi:16S rRNA G527 N7-methylase RsmG